MTPAGQEVWLELPPVAAVAAKRLLVFLHGAGSSPEVFAPVALAWMLKFPSAAAVLMRGLQPASAGQGHDWFDARGSTETHAARIAAARNELARRVGALQTEHGLAGAQTAVIGFSQGAIVALDLARVRPDLMHAVIAYSGRMLPLPGVDERIQPVVHLIHGELDSLVPLTQARRTHQRLQAVGATATLDIVEGQGHSITQDMIILGTTRLMQTLFRGRKAVPGKPDKRRVVTTPTTLH